MRADSSPLRVAVLTSHGAPGLEDLVRDPRRGSVFEIAGIVSSGAELRSSIPVIPMPQPMRNLHAREACDRQLAGVLEGLKADFILLVDYRFIVTVPMLDAFAGRMIALHDGDRGYGGLHAVVDAVFAGEHQTRSSAYIVTDRVDEGPLVLLSEPYPIAPMAEDARLRGRADLLTSYAKLHRTWMVQNAWGPMLRRLVEMLAAGTMQVVGEVAWVDGVPGPCRMGQAPAVCYEEREIAAGIPPWCPYIAT